MAPHLATPQAAGGWHRWRAPAESGHRLLQSDGINKCLAGAETPDQRQEWLTDLSSIVDMSSETILPAETEVSGTKPDAKQLLTEETDASTAASILLIDDTPSLLNLYAMELSHGGYRVHTAPGGKNGMTLMKAKEYDLVLCDINMPIMAGDEMAKEFRTWEATNRPTGVKQPIFALSAYGLDAEMRLRCETAGMNGMLQKPLPGGAVKDVLQAVRQRRDGSEEPEEAPSWNFHLF